jgi:putative Mg2+ transporter-C (MgtC) family protein
MSMAWILSPEDLLRIFMALLVGGLVGLEREFRDKAAGFRTLIFISIGAALFTMFSSRLAGDKDPTRIAAAVVTGVGFLGAGVIMRESGRITGLTTAALIWVTAALGAGMGAGLYALSLVTTLLVLVVLWLFPYLEHWVDNVREERSYQVVCPLRYEKLSELEAVFNRCGLRVRKYHQAKSGSRMICDFEASGTHRSHEELTKTLFADEEIIEIH